MLKTGLQILFTRKRNIRCTQGFIRLFGNIMFILRLVIGISCYQSFSQRIEYSKAAITIIKRNVWFGVGTGNWKNEFKKAYHENNSQLNEDLYASSHNQYLNYTVKFGIIGFVLIMFLIIYPVFYSGRYKDPLFLIFLVFLFFANFTDSNFESHMGNSFFTFFYCIFLISGSLNYLQLKMK